MKLSHSHIVMNGKLSFSNMVAKPMLCGLYLLFYIGILSEGVAQQSLTNQDTLHQTKVLSLIEESEKYIQAQKYKQARTKAQQALDISQKRNYTTGEAESLNKLATVLRLQGNSLESVKYNLWLIRIFERIGDQSGITRKYEEVGYLYFELRAYAKAIEYFLFFQKAREKLNGKSELPIKILEVINRSHLQLREYTEAKRYSNMLLQRYKDLQDIPNLIRTYKILAFIAKEQINYGEAIGYNKALLEIYGQQKDVVQLTHTYNNIGFLYKRINNLKVSLDYFNKALELSQKLTIDLDEESQVALFTNVGIAYTNLSLFSQAKEYYLLALRVREKQENPVGEAYIHNHLASNYFVGGENALALKSVINAIDIGVTHNAKEVLATSYRVLSMIYEVENNLSKAQLYDEKYNDIKASLENEEVAKFEKMLDRQIAIEKREDEIKSLLAVQERKALEEERKENELALKRKELDLLRRDQEIQAIALQNQQLEKEKATQALALAKQQLQAEKKNQELRELERQKQLQDLQLKQQSLEKQQQEKAIALLEADKKLKEQKLREEATLRKYGYGVIGLFLLVLGIIIFSFIQKKKDNVKLQKQQDEIQDKNEQLLLGEKELRRNMQQLQLTQEVLEEQKQQLEIEHRKTQESIHYAQRIQFSILPSDQQRKAIIPESFVIYRPKDIVSGDFYWISNSGGKTITSVVDCTGHGVPGSLVSLIGNNLLNEAINEHRLVDPAEILDYLDVKVRIKLKQDEGNNRDGMDLGLCVLEKQTAERYKLTYGGAKNTLFVVANGELTTLKGDRKSIGGFKHNFSFTQQEANLHKGDTIYMTTDGFIDQANAQRERFGSKRLRNLIGELHHLTMSEQGKRFEEALDDHQQDTEQRDDINLIGIRI